MFSARQSQLAAFVLALLIQAVRAAVPLDAVALSVTERGALFHLGVEPIPETQIEISPCPPRCTATEYARLHPSPLYKPIEPDEIVFDGTTSLIWGDTAGSEWLVWGDAGGLQITVWDDSMWVNEWELATGGGGGGPEPKYRVSRENRIPDARPDRASERGAVAGSKRSGPVDPTDDAVLGSLDEVRAEMLTPIERGWLSNLLDRLSKSQYAVGGVTLGLIALMARLVR